jgi:cobyrinic acid a,c-diamide synthase
LAGVWCNRVGSRGHLDLLRQACRDTSLLGGLPKDASVAFPERHLGLRTADAEALPDAVLAQLGALATDWSNLDTLQALAATATPLAAREAAPLASAPRRCRIGLAWDAAFHFYYEDNLRRLEACGAELVRFSPIRDTRLPEVDGLYLGGGYPELHAAALAANADMRAAIGAFAAAERPVYAECGGMMYLGEAITDLAGETHPMVGALPVRARMCERLQALGYVEVETQGRTILGGAGLRFRGHQFRYSQVELAGEPPALSYRVRRRRGGDTLPEGYTRGAVLGSYVHAHWASNPQIPRAFVERCAADT